MPENYFYILRSNAHPATSTLLHMPFNTAMMRLSRTNIREWTESLRSFVNGAMIVAYVATYTTKSLLPKKQEVIKFRITQHEETKMYELGAKVPIEFSSIFEDALTMAGFAWLKFSNLDDQLEFSADPERYMGTHRYNDTGTWFGENKSSPNAAQEDVSADVKHAPEIAAPSEEKRGRGRPRKYW